MVCVVIIGLVSLIGLDINEEISDKYDVDYNINIENTINTITTDWPSKHYNSNHTSYSGSTDITNPSIAWSKKLVGTSDEWAGPIIVNGTIITVPMTTETNMYSTFIGNKTTKWSKNIGQTNAPPIYHNGIIYVQNYTGKLYALHESNGTELWNRTDLPTSYVAASSPVISDDDGLLFVTAGGGVQVGFVYDRIYALYINNGTESWNVTIFPEWSYAINFGSVYESGVLYILSMTFVPNNYTTAFYSNNGTVKWDTAPSKIRGTWDGDILLVDDVLYVGEYNYTLGNDSGTSAIFKNNGTLKWRSNIKGKSFTTPILINNTVYNIVINTTDSSPYLYGFNKETGIVTVNSSMDADDPSGSAYGSIVRSQNLLYFSTVYKIYAFDFNGNKQWSYNVSQNMSAYTFSQLALVDGVLWFNVDDGYTYGIQNNKSSSYIGTYKLAKDSVVDTVNTGFDFTDILILSVISSIVIYTFITLIRR